MASLVVLCRSFELLYNVHRWRSNFFFDQSGEIKNYIYIYIFFRFQNQESPEAFKDRC